MKKTLQEQYLLIKEGKGHKDVFIKEAKRLFPNMVRNAATFKEASDVLKSKQIIKENIVEIGAINQIPAAKKESYELAFEKFLTEENKKEYFDDEKAELKKVSKQVEDDLGHMYDNKDDKNINNVIFGQVMMGYYAEMKDPKNKDKTADQLKDIVLKNLAKNPIYYTEKGQFGDLDLGYTVDAPGLGEPKEPKGPHKSSGYGTLSESTNEGEFDSVKHEFEKEPTNKFTAKEREDKISVLRKKELDRRKKEDLEETQVRTVVKEMIRQELNENVQKRLKAIEEESQYEVLSTKADKIQQEIEMREARMTRLDEDEDMKDLLDKNKIKNLKKEIKVLQKAANKVNKMLDKVNKKNFKSDEPDEPEEEEIVDEAIDDGKLDDTGKTLDDIKGKIEDIGKSTDEMFEENKDELSIETVAKEGEKKYEEIDEKEPDLNDREKLRKTLEYLKTTNEFKSLPEEDQKNIGRHLNFKYSM